MSVHFCHDVNNRKFNKHGMLQQTGIDFVYSDLAQKKIYVKPAYNFSIVGHTDLSHTLAT